MRMGNMTMLIAAFVCAAAAALLSRAWLMGQAGTERVVNVQQTTSAMPMRSIVVAARDLKSGDKLNAETLRLMSWPGETLPRGAFTSVEAMFRSGQDRLLISAVAENEPVLEQKLAGSAQSLLAGKLMDNMNAVTIRVNDVAGVAGFVQPEDRVDVFMISGGGTTGESPQPSSDKTSVAVLLQNVRVLAIDQASERKGQASPPKAVTLEVTTQDAQKLLLAGTIGQLSLALRRSNGVASSEPRPIAMEDLIARQSAAQGVPAKPGQVIGVTRAAERKEYMVQPDSAKNRRSEAMR
jgi:pilus assembly protein CpaB